MLNQLYILINTNLLHFLRDINTKQIHRRLDNHTCEIRQTNSHLLYLFILFLQYATILIKSIKRFSQIIHKISNQRRRIIFPCFLNNVSKGRNIFYNLLFFIINCNIVGNCSRVDVDILLLSLINYGADTSVSVLNKRTCVAIEINTLLRVEKYSFGRIYFKDKIF